MFDYFSISPPWKTVASMSFFWTFFSAYRWNRFKGCVYHFQKVQTKNMPQFRQNYATLGWFYVGLINPTFVIKISFVAIFLNNFRDHIINIHKPLWIFSRLPNRSPIATAWAFGALATLALQGELLSLGVDGWLSSLIWSAPPDMTTVAKTMQTWYFVVVMDNFVVVWMYFLWSHPQFFFPHFVKQRLSFFLCFGGLGFATVWCLEKVPEHILPNWWFLMVDLSHGTRWKRSPTK